MNKFSRLSLILSLVILSAGISPCLSVPAFAANKTAFTLQELQAMAIEQGRTMKVVDLNAQLVDANKGVVADAQRTIDKNYDKINSKLDAASGQLAAAKAQIDALKQLQTGLVGSALDGASLATLQGAGLLTPEQVSAITAAAGVDSTATLSTAISKLEAAYHAGQTAYSSAQSTAMTAEQTLQEAQDELNLSRLKVVAAGEDVQRTKQDMKEELKLITALLSLKSVELSTTIQLADAGAALTQHLARIEARKAQLGLSLNTDAESKAVEAVNNQISGAKAANWQVILKQKLNDLVGREPLSALTVIPMPETTTMAAVTPWSISVVEKLVQNDYKIYQLKRDISDLNTERKQTYGSNKLSVLDIKVSLKEQDIKAREVAIFQDSQKAYDAVSVAAIAYQNAVRSFLNAEKVYGWAKKSKALGLLSPMKLEAAQIPYLQAGLQKQKAWHDYYLAAQEWALLQAGVNLDNYRAVKSAL